jgi:hypothetical protein
MMRNGLRNWNEALPKSDNDLKLLSFDFLKGISKTKIASVLGVLLALVSSYFNFLGYSIVKSKLEILGFDSVSVDSVSLENIYQSILGLAPGVVSLFSEESFVSIAWQLLILILIVASIPWLVLLGVKIASSKWYQNKKKSKLFSEKKYNRYLAARLSVVFSLGATAFYVYFLAVIILLIWICFLFSAVGISLGHNQAKELINDPICQSVEDKTESYVGCRILTTKSDVKLEGKRLYQNSKYQYFITNEAIYELNIDNKVMMS